MRLRLQMQVSAVVLLVSVAGAQSIGTVRTQTANVQGTVSVSAGTATIQNNATVTAGRDTAEVALTRGGSVRVCLGSAVGFSQAAAGGAKRPLLFALQHGATEIATSMRQGDAIVTPDLRIESSDAAPLDLRLRVNEAGDTCVENLGKNAPMLHVTEQFSGAGYLVKPGQHIVFERGSVRAVVNRATTTCGCPKRGKDDDFPYAQSAGLAPSTVPAAPAGQEHVQTSVAMDYNGQTGTVSGPPLPDGTVPVTTASSSGAASTQARTAAAQGKSAGEGHGPFAAIGRFFRRLFGGR